MTQEPFFIGWTNRLPPGMRLPVLGVAAGLVVVMLALSVLLALGAGGGGAGNWAGDAVLRGTFTARPYPLLHLPPDAAHKQGHTVLLSAFGKAQIPDAARHDGQAMQAAGALIRRGDLDMLAVNDPAQLQPAEGIAPPLPPVKLGRWRLSGEICDGKCAAGAMRPGSGLAHRACASLCLAGEIPPVLVSVEPVAGSVFFLLAGPDGGAVSPALLRLTGVRLQLDGDLERQGDLLVFRADPATVREL